MRKVIRNMDHSFWLSARDVLYAPSHRQDNTYHGLCYTSRGALAGMGPPWRIEYSSTELHLAPLQKSNILLLTIFQLKKGSEMYLCGKSVRSWCDGSSNRSFMGWIHWANSRSSQCSTTGVTKAMVCAAIGKSSLCGCSGFPLLLSEWSFMSDTI